MKYEDWHTHNSLCHHATGTPEDYIERAIEIELNVIGFSDHFPYEYLTATIPSIKKIHYQEYAMTLAEVDEYLSKLENLKTQHKDQIQIKIGFEVDYFQNQEDYLNLHLNKIINRLDYILGSVHVLFGKYGIFAFDDNKFLSHYEHYDSVDDVYLEFYQTLQNMINSNSFSFDVLTHFDLPKKFNKRAENNELVMNEAFKTLELAKKRGLTIEINSSGLRRAVKEQYPSKKIIQQMYELDIPVLLGSDAHHHREIAYHFEKIVEELKKIGYNQLAHYEKRKRTFIEL